MAAGKRVSDLQTQSPHDGVRMAPPLTLVDTRPDPPSHKPPAYDACRHTPSPVKAQSNQLPKLRTRVRFPSSARCDVARHRQGPNPHQGFGFLVFRGPLGPR